MLNDELLPYFARYEKLIRFYFNRDELICKLGELNLEINELISGYPDTLSYEQRIVLALLQNWIEKKSVLKDINTILDKYLGRHITDENNVSWISGYETLFHRDLYGKRVYYSIRSFQCTEHEKMKYKLIGGRLLVFYKKGKHHVCIGNEHLMVNSVRVYGYDNGFVTSIPYTKKALDLIIRRVKNEIA